MMLPFFLSFTAQQLYPECDNVSGYIDVFCHQSTTQNQITRVFKILPTESEIWLRVRTTDSSFALFVEMNAVLISSLNNVLIIIWLILTNFCSSPLLLWLRHITNHILEQKLHHHHNNWIVRVMDWLHINQLWEIKSCVWNVQIVVVLFFFFKQVELRGAVIVM